MPALLYASTAALLLWMTHRWVRPLSRPAALALALFPLFFTGRALLTGAVFGPIDMPYATEPLNTLRAPMGLGEPYNGMLNDVYTQMIPYRQAVREAIRHAEWPLWNRYTLSGDILAAAAQPAAYSPFTLLALLLPVAVSFTFTAAIFFFLAALGAFVFARELGCREQVAAFAAAGWMYSAGLAFFILWPIAESWALLPLVLLAVRLAVERPSIRSGLLLTIVLALLVLAGHPETLLQAIAIGVAWGAFELLRVRRSLPRAIAVAVGSGIVAAAISAIYLLPIFEAIPQTREHVDRPGTLLYTEPENANQRLIRLAIDLLPQAGERAWKLPGAPVHLPPESAAVGSVVLAAAIYGLWRVRRGEKWFFAAVLLFGLLTHVQWTPLMNALSRLPLFNLALNERFSFAAAFAFVILGALGVEELCRRADRRGFAITALAVLAAVTVAAVMIESSGIVAPSEEKFGGLRMFADIAMLGIAILAVVSPRVQLRIAVPLLVLAVLVQRTMQDGGIYPTLPAKAAYPPVAVLGPAQRAQPPFRVTGISLAFIPGTSAMYGLEDVRGYAAMTFRPYAETWPLWSVEQPVWFNRVDDLTKPFLSLLNVRYAIVPLRLYPVNGWHEVSHDRGSKLLENEHVLERAFIPASVKLGYGDDDAIREMAQEPDFSRHAWIHIANIAPSERSNGPGRVTIRPRKLGFDIDASMDAGGWVVVSEPAWKGWRVYVDGHRIRHQIADISFIGVYVPKGDHHIGLVYWPTAFVQGRAITFATIALLVAAALIARWRRLRVARPLLAALP